MKRTFRLAFLMLIAFASGYSDPQRGKRMAAFCSIDGRGGVKCDYNGKSCVALHPNNDEGTGVCQGDDPLPNCCNASPDSADHNAKECHCCGAKK